VEVRTYDESATEAARIANAVANAFREYRLEQQRQLQTDSLKVLTKQLQAQEDKVRDAQSELDRLRKELGLSDMDASGTAPAAMVDADTLRRFETMRIEGEVQLAGQQAQLDQFLGMTNQKLREVLPSVVPDAALHELLSQLNVTELALARLRADTGPNHPETVKTAGQVKLLNQKLDDRITGIMTGLTNQMAVARV
jgi:uncharacterized protein involved in exopolysaccharide biosynthesis